MKHSFYLLLLSTLFTAAVATPADETAVITHIADGDTFDVRYAGDTEDTRIRFLGVQAMEIHPTASGTPNDCWADEATQRLIELTGGVGATVTLRAQDATTEIRYRLARHIFTQIDGQEVNVVKTMMQEGLVFPFSHPVENMYNEEYIQDALTAKSQSLGLWSATNHCTTPTDSANSLFEILVHYDANGEDDANLHDEWIKVKNTSGRTIDLSGWWLRDSALNFFRFPSNTIIADNAEIIVHGGSGTNTSDTFYWGNTESMFDNDADGVYLLDYLDDSVNPSDDILPKGNIKASFLYPCVGSCSDNLQGKVAMVAHYDAQGEDNTNLNDEWIRITNISNTIIELENYVVHSAPKGSDNYMFTVSTPLNPNESLFLYTGDGTDSALKKYWHKATSVLANESDRVWLDTLDSRLISDFSWPADNNATDILDGKVQLDVRYDAEGEDNLNLNGEWARITNISNVDIDLKDYILSSAPAGSDSYYFANTTVLQPQEALYIYSGAGTDTTLKKYWNKVQGVHANAADKVWLHTLDNHIIEEVSWPSDIPDPLVGKIDMTVNYDAQGDDNQNVNGEWVKITNTSANTINLKDYLVTSAPTGSDSYWFENDTPLTSNETLYLYVGQGTDTSLKKYWGKTTSILANDQDKVSLVTLSGSVIVEQMWPCVGSCTDPLQGKIKLQAHYDANGIDDDNLNDEWVRVTNISAGSIDLQNYVLHSEPVGSVSYTFNSSTVLDSNASLYLYTGTGSDTVTKKYWSQATSVLANESDRVWLDTSDGILIAEHSWPCIIHCDESLKDKISIVANYDAQGVDDDNLNDEWVRISNISNDTVDLKDHVVHSLPLGSDNYVFMEDTPLNAGESLYLYTGAGTDTALKKYWGKSTGILANSLDKVWIDTLAGYKITEFAWPSSVGSPMTSKIKIIANYDAEGNDANNPNGEWIRISNISIDDIDLKDHIVHSLPVGSDHYLFKETTIVHPNEDLFLYIGAGTETRLAKHWDKSSGILANGGDKVWMTTLDGIVVKEFSWPCVVDCNDPLLNKVDIVARFDADGDDNVNLNGEWIRVYNKSDDVVNLKDYTINSAPVGSDKYTFMQNTILDKGESLYLYTGSGADSSLVKYWGKTVSVLANASDSVWLSTFDGQTLAEFSWPCEQNCTDTLANKLSLSIQSDAVGDDTLHPNGEWITINNLSENTINMKDYIVNMNSHSYYFMEDSYLLSQSYIRLFIGDGPDVINTLYWGKSSGILANDGGAISLTNNQGTLVVNQSWPCEGNGCVYDAPLEITAVNYDAIGSDASNPNGEWIILKNTSGIPLNLRNWEIVVRGYQHHFMHDFMVGVNAQVQVYMGMGTNNATQRYWGLDGGVLRNGGDVVQVFNPQRNLSHCFSWGAEVATCSNLLDSDHDGILNINDGDDDGDGVDDAIDAFPLSRLESVDTDADGLGNNVDTDDDNDGISDEAELANGLNPLDASDATTDSDGDGINNINEINAGSDPKNRHDPVLNYVKHDFDDDGVSDILWRSGSTNHLWQLHADGTHTYVNIGGKSSTYAISAIDDFNADGIADVLWKNGDNNYIWYMHADGTHTYKKIASSTYSIAATGDFNKDGIADMLLRKGYRNKIWYMDVDGTHTSVKISNKSTLYNIAGTGDLNGDGVSDILWREGHKNYIWYMNTDGTHTYKKINSKSYEVLAVEDFNADGIADILWRKDSLNNLWYMHADGTYMYKNIGTKGIEFILTKTADFNGDGITDILWRKGSANYLWYMHADGSHTYKKISGKSSAYGVQ